jgi:hypothetical protein
MANQYSLIFGNDSIYPWDACLYQNDLDLGVPGAQPLAWLSRRVAPSARLVFTWEISYSFVQAATGTLVPGVIFAATQRLDTDLSTNNQVPFTFKAGYSAFGPPTAGPRPDSLYIRQERSIPLNTLAVGIGVSGASTYAIQAMPNVNLKFTPHPNYWLTFGTFIPGEVLEVGVLNNPLHVQFPPNVYSMTAILQRDHSWVLKPTSEVNAEFVAAREGDAKTAWGSPRPERHPTSIP